MTSSLPKLRSKYVSLILEKYISESISLLVKFENIFTQKVRSNFKSEEEMLTFVKQLLFRFSSITLLNAFAVSFNTNFKVCTKFTLFNALFLFCIILVPR